MLKDFQKNHDVEQGNDCDEDIVSDEELEVVDSENSNDVDANDFVEEVGCGDFLAGDRVALK